VFSGGDYEEVARWLANFAMSHAKRENLHAEVLLDREGPREGKAYGLRVRIGEQLSSEIELAYPDVRDRRGSLSWCQALAERIRGLVRDTVAPTVGQRRSA
jgi:hypothetical protein